MVETGPMSSCPMAEMCKGMMQKRGSGIWMIIPGLIFLGLGVAIILYPQILAWLVAIALIGMGIAMLMMANFMRGVGRRYGHRHG